MRCTPQREVVLEIVRACRDHPSAGAVYRQARRRMPHISLGTVYRNLRRLAEDGAIREIHAGGQPARFDGNLSPHDHVRCVRCGTIGDLPLSRGRSSVEEQAARAMNFRVLSRHVEVLGLCPGCRGAAGGARPSGPQDP